LPVTLSTETLPPPCRFLVEYWERLRGARLLPHRAEIDPLDMVPILSRLHIFEVRAPGEILFRLTGTDYVRLLGFEPTGKNLVTLTPAPLRRLRAWRTWILSVQPCAAWYTHAIAFEAGRSEVAQSVMLPLAPDRPGAPYQLIAVTALADLDRRREGTTFGRALDFAFLDIGAGVPEGLEPPAEWSPMLPG